MTILSLPPEIIEHILIAAAGAGFPHAVAAFAQTCKLGRGIVYNTADNHLWREIFLTTFDDPRASGGGPGWSECTKSQHSQQDTFDWGAEFRKRVWAADYIRRQTDPSRPPPDPVAPEDSVVTNTCAFNTILSVICTSLPCPPTIVFSFLPPSTPSTGHEGLIFDPNPTYPTFPPLPQTINGLSDSAGPTGKAGQTFGETLCARNTAWLQVVLERGLPPSVTLSFAGDKWQGGLAGQFLDGAGFREMQAAARIMTCTGFVPTPPEVAERMEGDSVRGRDMSAEKQLRRARRLARMRVYNMRYLARDRHWGPFLPVEKNSGRRRRAVPHAVEDELLEPILALFQVTRQHAHDDEEEASEEMDEDGDESVDDGTEGGDGTDVEGDEEERAEEDEEDDMDIEGKEDAEEEKLPSATQLRPDWGYLAAVRVVVEANLREACQASDLRGLFSLDGLRSGSAPWDSSAYKPLSAPVDKGNGKGKARESGQIEGWDWAGVTGVWMRCICWMDYRDLILHNLSGEFEDPHLQEAVRIVSMRLHITSYSPAAVKEYAHLPTIHIEGETVGSGANVRHRSMHGTVSVVADGSVRWQIVSKTEGGDRDEWASEGVQIGGVASAMGVLGMWTGADHERMDPLGPCWAWKVC